MATNPSRRRRSPWNEKQDIVTKESAHHEKYHSPASVISDLVIASSARIQRLLKRDIGAIRRELQIRYIHSARIFFVKTRVGEIAKEVKVHGMR
jgi:hypothetical protein